MSIGIISAMKEEIQALQKQLKISTRIQKGMRTYYQGTLFDQEVVLVFSRWGKVASATTVTQLINDFDIDEIIFTGVAGAAQMHINIGDLIIGESLYQHDMDASPLVAKFEIPLLGKISFQTDPYSRLQMHAATKRFMTGIEQYVPKASLESLGIDCPKIHLGDIASGDQFVSSAKQLDIIMKDLPGVLCVEMEGAAVAQVCHEYKVPFTIIRTISDHSNDNAHIDFPKFAHEIASQFALGIIRHYFEIKYADADQ